MADKVKNIWNFQKIVKISDFHGRAINIFSYSENVYINTALQLDMHQTFNSFQKKILKCGRMQNNEDNA